MDARNPRPLWIIWAHRYPALRSADRICPLLRVYRGWVAQLTERVLGLARHLDTDRPGVIHQPEGLEPAVLQPLRGLRRIVHQLTEAKRGVALRWDSFRIATNRKWNLTDNFCLTRHSSAI